MSTPNMNKVFPIYSRLSAPKSTGTNITECKDCTGNHPTSDIHIEGSGQGIKIQNDKYIPFVMNMVIMCHVHPLSTEIERKTYKQCLKAYPDTLQDLI